jgi:hypothetical protein
MANARVILGDCKAVLKTLGDNSFDSLITDPPAGIAFMGKAWDSFESLTHFQDDMAEVFKEALRVMKPGAHGLVWALPRTSHHTGMALERAGFEIRDTVTHLFGTGMPKGHNIAKAGAGDAWEGWNTALKPAHEVWWLVRKPLGEKTVAAQVLSTGTGAINVDGCRVQVSTDDFEEMSGRSGRSTPNQVYGKGAGRGAVAGVWNPSTQGRWPANVVLSHAPECEDPLCVDGCAVAVVDEGSGQLSSHGGGTSLSFSGGVYGEPPENRRNIPRGDTGGASRFFYTSKVPPSERKLPDGTANSHPTAKSIKLMRYFVKLVTPPGGTVLDPFAGSGTTGVAALREGMNFVGVELDPEHHRVAQLRVESEAEVNGQDSLLDLALSEDD